MLSLVANFRDERNLCSIVEEYFCFDSDEEEDHIPTPINLHSMYIMTLLFTTHSPRWSGIRPKIMIIVMNVEYLTIVSMSLHLVGTSVSPFIQDVIFSWAQTAAFLQGRCSLVLVSSIPGST